LIQAWGSWSGFFHFLSESRKYPIGYTIPFAVVYRIALWAFGDISFYQEYLLGRLITFVWTIGTVLVVYKMEKRYKLEAVILLLSSLVFVLFSSAIRPHGPVAFWAALSALFAIRSAEESSQRNIIWSLLCAFLATITLHSGLLSFVFPAWAMLRKRSWMDMIVPTTIGGVVILVSLMIGYWPLFSNFSGALHGSVVGHEGVILTFDILKPFKLLPFFIGSDLLLFAFAGYALWKRKTLLQDTAWVPMVIYLVLFYVIFGFQPISAGRFFIATFPFLAVLGAPAFAQCASKLKLSILIVLCLAWIKLGYLAVMPNTHLLVANLVNSRPGMYSVLGQPWYFFPIPQEKVVSTEAQLNDMQFVVIPDYFPDKKPPEDWQMCLHAVSSPFTNEIVLLWNDTPWAYANLFAAKALGPSMKVFCPPVVTK
jgi:hypothetical protein